MYDPNANQIQGSMTHDELVWLYETACMMDSVVEVGSWKGRSADALLSGCKGKVYCVDHFQGSVGEACQDIAKEEDIKAQFLANVGHYDNLTLLDMPSLEAAKKFKDKSIDMVFIDGSHDRESVLADVAAWMPKAKRIFCGHDWGFDEVRNTLQELKLPITRLIDNTLETGVWDARTKNWKIAHIPSIWVCDLEENQ